MTTPFVSVKPSRANVSPLVEDIVTVCVAPPRSSVPAILSESDAVENGFVFPPSSKSFSLNPPSLSTSLPPGPLPATVTVPAPSLVISVDAPVVSPPTNAMSPLPPISRAVPESVTAQANLCTFAELLVTDLRSSDEPSIANSPAPDAKRTLPSTIEPRSFVTVPPSARPNTAVSYDFGAVPPSQFSPFAV